MTRARQVSIHYCAKQQCTRSSADADKPARRV